MPPSPESIKGATLPHSSPSEEGGNKTVAIVGGGLAGLAAACALSASGFRVTLFERRPYLGGRASSYEHPGTGEVVDNCQHVLFQLCSNLIDFYRKIGIEGKILWFDTMTFIEPGGRQSLLKPASLPAPLHVTPSFLGFKFLSARDKLALTRALAVLILTQPKDDGFSFHDWLIRHHQTPAAIERFWKPILVSSLSEDLDRISVPHAAQVIRVSMRSRDARLMGVPTVPLTELYSAARDYIVSHGGDVRLRSNIRSFQPTQRGVRIELQDLEEEFDYAVLAIPFDALAKLLPDSPQAAELREQISHFETSPITGVHFWFDRQITDLPHAVLLDRTIQWMFHKSLLLRPRSSQRGVQPLPAFGSSGNGELTGKNDLTPVATIESSGSYQGTASALLPDTTSLVSSRAPQDHPLVNDSAEPGELDYLELVISSSKSLINKSRQEIIELALAELREFFPAAREARLVKATVIKEVNATFSPQPGIEAHRPPSQTVWPNVFLAGDWTATGWPATMEGAVRSGYLATEAITKKCGAPKKFLVPDLPPSGLMRLR